MEAAEEPAAENAEWGEAPPPDEDDVMMAPAPDVNYLGHVPPRRHVSTSNMKQTIVPILLTIGVLMLVFGTLHFVLGPDSPYASIPTWTVAAVYGTGVVLIGLGVFTAFQIKAELEQMAKKKKKA